MNNLRICLYKLLAATCLLVLLTGTSHGFNDNAHERLTRRAVGDPLLPNSSQLNIFLIDNLGYDFPQGINEPIDGGPNVVGLIAKGAVKEDYPDSRVLNHFHDPTQPWNSAGLFLFTGRYMSSIEWSQLLTPQPYGETRTWKTARDAYFKALTSTTVAQRKQWFRETFFTVGHLIHHVQDAAVPAHTRNDNHFALFGQFPAGDRFHFWAENNLDVIDQSIQQSGILRYSPSLLEQASPNKYAPLPIARIIDSTDGNLGTLSYGLNIGLA